MLRLFAESLLFAVVLSTTAAAQSVLDSRVRKAERIVLGRVERVVELSNRSDGGERSQMSIATVRVERKFLGPEGGVVVSVLLAFPRHAPRHGERALFFLDSLDDAALPPAARSQMEAAMKGPFGLSRDLWDRRLEASRVLLPQWLVAEHEGEDQSLDEVLASLEAALARCLPAIHAEYVVLGPRPWDLRLEPDRTIVERGQSPGTLSPERWAEILSVFESNRFRDLPAHVGVSIGPEEPVAVIELRTRSGTYTVGILWGAPAAAADLDAWRRARSVWRALPGVEKPELSGE